MPTMMGSMKGGMPTVMGSMKGGMPTMMRSICGTGQADHENKRRT